MTSQDNIVGRAGGLARAKKLPTKRKAEIATKAAVARWGYKATHMGNFKDELGIDVECYVLDDEQKTAVISQTGMARALGMSPRGNSVPKFLTTKSMLDNGGGELVEKIQNPIKFQWAFGGGEAPPTTVHGFDVTLLIDICKGIVKAESAGLLHKRQEAMAKQAHIILSASAKAGIKGLVYALAGYNPSTQEVIDAFKMYVQDEARTYEREFPNELYMAWHRLYEIPVPERGKPWQFKYLTEKHIYFPLAKSNGKIYELLKALKAQGGDRRKKLFQFLSIIGARALSRQIGRVLEMSESSNDSNEYERKIAARFGDQQELELIMPTSSNVS